MIVSIELFINGVTSVKSSVGIGFNRLAVVVVFYILTCKPALQTNDHLVVKKKNGNFKKVKPS